MSTEIARILHGSHLFGTATETSDHDWKAVYVPDARSIVLGETNVSTCEGAAATGVRNSAGDVDLERHDLRRFVSLLSQGQPVAYEMLFAPTGFHAFEPDSTWTMLQENLDRIVSRQAGKFVGYCRQQALAYGMKGERVAAAEKALALLEAALVEHGPREKLGRFIDRVVAEVGSPHVHEEPRTTVHGKLIRHLKVASKMVAETVSVNEAVSIARGVVSEYGKRARMAKDSDGKDWKALSHAVRIGREAVELFTTGQITLPRPEAAHLLAIKAGNVPADEVGDEIVSLLDEVERASASSGLQDGPDVDFLKETVVRTYTDAVCREWRPEPRFHGA